MELNKCCLYMQRITIPEIKQHPWFLKNLPKELIDAEKQSSSTKHEPDPEQQLQSVEDIMRIIQEAKIPGETPKPETQSSNVGSIDTDDLEGDLESEIDNSGDFVVRV
ncbi:OLC1v1031562C1 [Oldenlandia corymbosa var. corymbosa]|uniref:OLC1v1031562C1 n=1 Tax=Oldenlandia corymbosa var. corymbosa TaxID=529605 RepID=A0AAV1CLN0_OLDCO|nr:OLC1v1031562C1 [Oldenlandia corymbosa var. corymbosa]